MGVIILRMTANPPIEQQSTPEIEENAVAEPTTEESLAISFTSPVVPTELSIESEGSQIAHVTPEAFGNPVILPIAIPAEGIELVVRASWNAGDPKTNALRIRITDPSGAEIDTTLWGDASISDVIAIPGKERP